MPPPPFAAAGVSCSVVLYRLVPAARNCSAEQGTRCKSWEDAVDLPPLDQSGSWDRIRVDSTHGPCAFAEITFEDISLLLCIRFVPGAAGGYASTWIGGGVTLA